MDDPHNQSESTAIHLSKSLNTSSPAFPPELEREIFEFAAYGFIECISTLVLVAKKVNEWVEPIRYNTIIATALNRRLRKWMPLYEGRSPFTLTKTPIFDKAMRYARHVCIIAMWERTAAEVLEHCTNARSIALISMVKVQNIEVPLLPLLESLPNLRRLTTDLASLLDINRKLGVPEHTVSFTTLTHLYLSSTARFVLTWNGWWSVFAFPHLTHLTLACSTPEFIEGILKGYPKIKLIVALYEIREDMLQEQLQEQRARWHGQYPDVGVMVDHRVVQMPSFQNWLNDWKAGVRGEEDFWIRAKEIQVKEQASTNI